MFKPMANKMQSLLFLLITQNEYEYKHHQGFYKIPETSR